MVVNCSGGGQAVVNFAVTATDESGVPPNITCVPPSGSAFPIGQTTVACIAADSDSLSSTCSFNVTVMDIAPPILHCPSNMTIEFTSEAGVVATYSVTAADLCDPTPTVNCVPPSGHMLPIGETIIHCATTDLGGNSNACSFTVAVQGARGTKENILAELIALRVTVTNRYEDRRLDEAIKHLTKSLVAKYWVDETHLERKHGGRAFYEERLTVRKLCNLVRRRTGQIPDPPLQGFINRIFKADRLLATVAIQEAIGTGVSSKKIEQAQRFLTKGDAAVGDDACNNGIAAYRNAWRRIR